MKEPIVSKRQKKRAAFKAHRTRPVWDKAQAYSEPDMPTDNDKIVEWAEQKLTEGKLTGFKNNATRIAKRQGIRYDRAAAILAASSRRASPAAKRKNPSLKRVRGKADNG